MTPICVTLKGSIGIKAGLGLDSLVLDLQKILPGDANTIAIKGDNGSGKSTLMNIGMTPFLNPPMLHGSIYDHFSHKGCRILKWEHNGTVYESHIVYTNTPKNKKTTAVLYVDGDVKTPVVLPDHTASDGKAKTYNACLEHILGSQSIYFLSAFRSQSAPHLADYDDPKGLMKDLLNLEEIDDLATKASSVRLELEKIANTLRDPVCMLETKEERLSNGIQILESSKVDLKKQQVLQHECIVAQTQRKAAYEQAYISALDRNKQKQEIQEAEQRVSEREDRGRLDLSQIADDMTSLRMVHGQHDRGRHNALTVAHEDIRSVEKEIVFSTHLLGKKSIAQAAKKKAEELSDKKGDHLKKIAVVMEKIADQQDSALSLTRISHLVETAKKDVDAFSDQEKELLKRAGYVHEVPCKGEGKYRSCPALQDAMAAKEGANTAHNYVMSGNTEWKQRLIEKASATNALNQYGDPQAELRTLAHHRVQLDEDLAEASNLAALLPQIAAAEDTRSRANTRKQNLQKRVKQLEQEQGEENNSFSKAMGALVQRQDDYKKQFNDEIAALIDKLNSLPVPGDNKEEEIALDHLNKSEQKLASAVTDVENTRASIAQYSAKIDDLQRDISEGATIKNKYKYLFEEVATWHLLTASLRGVIDLSIETAGPSISAIANKLLRDAYGPRFSLSWQSQRTLANGKVVECLDILVNDNESDITTSVRFKSGGQNVWFDYALTMATTVFHADACGINYDTQFTDEADGALDEDSKRRYYRMVESAFKMGGFKKRFFVSHHPEAWAMADAVIDLDSYRVAE